MCARSAPSWRYLLLSLEPSAPRANIPPTTNKDMLTRHILIYFFSKLFVIDYQYFEFEVGDQFIYHVICNIDGLMQKRCNSSAYALELHLFGINPWYDVTLDCYDKLKSTGYSSRQTIHSISQNVNGLAWDCSISTADALEKPQFWIHSLALRDVAVISKVSFSNSLYRITKRASGWGAVSDLSRNLNMICEDLSQKLI